MAETKPIPVRLDESVISGLDCAAKRMGTNRAALMRFLVKTFVDQYERHGTDALPHDWQEVMKYQDGRASGQLRVAESLSSGGQSQGAPRKPVKYAEKRRKKK